MARVIAERQLRRSVAPYVGEACILVLISLAVLLLVLRRNDWQLLLVIVVLWLLAFADFSFGFRYRILWSDSRVLQKASGGEVILTYDEITAVVAEIGGARSGLFPSRPFRRIAIYSGGTERASKHIDVSLRHFRLDDVGQFMNYLKLRRPDLVLPTVKELRR